VTFSYTQVSQYLRCPRSYRYRYLDGWREKESRASLCFGRCFEKALAVRGATLLFCVAEFISERAMTARPSES
jgi:hypothetical protein